MAMVTSDSAMKPEVSVLVVCYNQASTIEQALRSVAAQQTDFPFEIVIADDCSTDDTAERCRAFAAAHPEVSVRVLHRERNMGLVDNYFDALLQSRGRYVADCAGDDWWPDPGRLQRQRNLLAADPSVTVVHGNWAEVRGDADAVGSPARRLPQYAKSFAEGSELIEPLFRHVVPQVLHLSTAMYVASAVRGELASPEGRRMIADPRWGCEDFALTAWLLSRGKVAYIDKVELAYRVGGDSVSNPADPLKAYRQISRTLAMTLELAPSYHVGVESLRSYVDKRVTVLVKIARSIGGRDLVADASKWLAATAAILPWWRRAALALLLRMRL